MAIDLDVHGNTKPLEAAVQAAVNRIRRKPIKITVDDKGATQPLGNMKRAADEFSKSMEAANARILAFGASMAIINGVADAFKGMVRNLVEVEKSLADINVVMGLSAQNLDKFGDGLFKVAKETGAAFRVAADAATEYARQGLAVEETLKRTRDALVLTRLTGMDSAEAVKSLTAAMNTYGNQIKDTTQLVSKFAAVDVQFAVSAEDFAAAISRTGQAAKSAGVDIDELIGIVTSAQQQTARGGAVIGNALKTIFTKTGRTDTLNQLENLGIAVRDLEGNTIGAKRILTELANTFDHLSEAQKAQITQTMGGLFHINILKAVLSDAAKQNGILARATEISSSATDEAIQKNQQLRETMSAMATETGLAVKQLGVEIGELMLAPGMEKILNTVKSIAEGASDILGDGESVGSKFANGLLKGIGNVITGPGLVVLTTVFVKLFMTAAKFTSESLRSLIGVTTEAQKQKAIQTSLVTLIGQNATLGKEMLRTDISRTEKEKILLGLLQAQTAEANKLNAISKQLASTLYTRGYGPGLTTGKRRAYGHIPNFADPERSQAARGGYAAGSIRSMNMPGEGSVIYNSAETVKNFAGFKQPAIMPPQSSKAGKNYQQAFGSIHGFDPYAAGGFIPNFSLRMPFKRSKYSQKTDDLTIEEALRKGINKNTIRATFGDQAYQKALATTVTTTSQLKNTGAISLAAMLVPKEGYKFKAGDKAPYASYGTGKNKVTWPVYTLRPKIETSPKDLNEKVKGNFKSVGSKYASSISKMVNGNTVTGNQFWEEIERDRAGGAKGAWKAAVGAIFEAAVNAAVGYKAADRHPEQGDFDIRGGEINKIKEIFHGFPGGISVADYKSDSQSKKNRKSFRDKVLKEKMFRKSQLKNKARSAASGFVPNFADPLSDAIGREKAAGVPVSQIRVGSHGALMNRDNPLGLGVTNTYDEPNGLRDVFGANGFVPNYKKPNLSGSDPFGRKEMALSIGLPMASELVRQYSPENMLSSAAGGALSGAGTGAMIGSMIPVVGTTIGAILGGLAGAGSAIWSSLKKSEALQDKANEEKEKAIKEQNAADEETKKLKQQEKRAVILQLNTQKAIADAQHASKMQQLEINAKYSSIVDSLTLQERVIGSSITEQQKANFTYTKAIQNAAKKYETGKETAEVGFRQSMLDFAKGGNVIAQLKTSLASGKSIDSDKINLNEELSNLTNEQLQNTIARLDLTDTEKITLEQIVQARVRSLELMEREREISERRAETEKYINDRLAKRNDIISKAKRNLESRSSALSHSQAMRGFGAELSGARRKADFGEGYKTHRQQADFALNESKINAQLKIRELQENNLLEIQRKKIDLKKLELEQEEMLDLYKKKEFEGGLSKDEETYYKGLAKNEEIRLETMKLITQEIDQQKEKTQAQITNAETLLEIEKQISKENLKRAERLEAIQFAKTKAQYQDKISSDEFEIEQAQLRLSRGAGYISDFQRRRNDLSDRRAREERGFAKLEEDARLEISQLKAERGYEKLMSEQSRYNELYSKLGEGNLFGKEMQEFGGLRDTLESRKEALKRIEEQSQMINSSKDSEIEKTRILLDLERQILEQEIARKTGPGAFTNGMEDAFGRMRDQVSTMDYELGKKIPFAFADGMANAMTEALNGTKNIKDALTDAAISFLSMIQKAMMQKAAYSIVGALGLSKGGNVRNYSRGGGVPAMVSNGEYIMGRDAVSKYGGSFMHSLNAGGRIPGFNGGGSVEEDLIKKGTIRRFAGYNQPGDQGSAIAANFGGGRGFKSGRLYQRKAMSGFFYSRSGNLGLGEDASAIQSILQEEERRRKEEEMKRYQKKVKRMQLLKMVVGTIAMAGISKLSGGLGKKPSADSLGRDIDLAAAPEFGKSQFFSDHLNKNFPASSSFITPRTGGYNSLVNSTYGGTEMDRLSSGVFGGFHLGGPIQKYASGGYISGKSGIDQIPAMLSEGEYVIRASSARQLGKPMLDRINAGKFNEGGSVGGLEESSETGLSGNSVNNINISINVDKSGQTSKEEGSEGESSNSPQKNSDEKDRQVALADMIKKQVVSIIIDEQRPGGLLTD